MKYWIDTEYIAKPYSIDLVQRRNLAEDGREFYAESSDVDWSKANPWMQENVRPQLDGNAMSREDISYRLRGFTDHDEHPVFWGYFPAYDGVGILCGCSGASRNCRSTIRSSASTSNNGRSNWAIRNCLANRARSITRCLTHDGRGKPGRFWLTSIPLEKSDAPSAASTRKRRTPRGAGSLRYSVLSFRGPSQPEQDRFPGGTHVSLIRRRRRFGARPPAGRGGKRRAACPPPILRLPAITISTA